VEPELPFEFIIPGTAMSSQASPASKAAWKGAVETAARQALPEGAWALAEPLAVTIFIFPDDRLLGDIDNRIKPILDGMCRCVYNDDAQVERILVQKFEPGRVFSFKSPSASLAGALEAEKPLVYVRVSDDLHEGLT
jgi:crossover junction endodeoxyribonuclease RusA